MFPRLNYGHVRLVICINQLFYQTKATHSKSLILQDLGRFLECITILYKIWCFNTARWQSLMLLCFGKDSQSTSSFSKGRPPPPLL